MRRIKTILAMVLVLAIAAATTPLAALANTPDGSTTITIFHTNDMHGRFVRGMEFNSHAETIGVEYIASVVAATENALLLDAGDTFHGTPFSVFSEGLDPVRLMNAAGYHFMAPGNHDFNFGLNRLLQLEEAADFGILAANVFWTHDGSLVFRPYTTMEIAGFTFGFFGLATQDTPEVTHPNNVAGITFGCPIAASAQAVASLQALNVDFIVGIAHIGYHPIQDVARAVDGIHLIVDGHSHTLLEEGMWVNDTLIVQAFEHGRRLGRVTITFAANGDVSLSADILTAADIVETYQANPTVLALIADIEANFYQQTREVVAHTPVLLDHTHELVRTVEMPLANLVADAFQWASGADIALMNGGAIRDSIAPGDITVGDMLRVLPFINYLVVVEMTPAILFEALENGVSRWPTESGNGRFLQVAGMTYTFDVSAPVGSRITNVTIGGVNVSRNDNTTIFTVAITDFKFNGGDGFDMFEGLYVVYEGDVKNMVFINYLNSGVANVAGASVEGRILQAAAPVPYVPYVSYVPYVPYVPTAPIVPVPPIFTFAQLPIPTPGQPLTYVVQYGETLWTIAYNFYGSQRGDVVGRIIAANRYVLAPVNNRVQPGMVLTLPAQGLRDPITRTTQGFLYLVQQGDTLSTIAREWFGDASLWRYIYEANAARLRNPNQITAGQWIVIPFI